MDNLQTIQHQVSVILVSDTSSNTNIASSRVARKENTHICLYGIWMKCNEALNLALYLKSVARKLKLCD